MRKFSLSFLLVLSTMILASCSSYTEQAASNGQSVSSAATVPTVPQEVMDRYASGWPETSKTAVRATILKYGAPAEFTASMLIWRDRVPFKRIVIYKEEISHSFPFSHKDILEHVVNYRVNLDKVDELARFDGSISFNRTRGELSVRSDKEEMNILLLNLANEVVMGKMEVERARMELGRLALNLMNGNNSNMGQSLVFGGQVNTADADRSISGKINWAPARQAQEE